MARARPRQHKNHRHDRSMVPDLMSGSPRDFSSGVPATPINSTAISARVPSQPTVGCRQLRV